MSSSKKSFGNSRRGGPEPINPQLPVLDVAPLNSVPYISPTSTSNMDSSPRENENGAKAEDGPCLVYLPSHSPKELDDLLSASSSGIAVTGTAATGQIGPIIGRHDIFEDEDFYLFRVLLTGVANDEFSWNVDPDGKVLMKGVTYTGEKTVVKHSMVFKMLTQNLCLPGHFAVSFYLPGPVDNTKLSGHYKDGIFEGMVKKQKKKK
ncbi:hypothetical protein MLD38_027754 [Melastoma candidum]|uniref:Uncharacterized protein n=1 Tax=Melastoma candidum TaxID=119954 RepID=A0ACB9P4F2_9MYRT|nr:hypothetical protein MLD38_027754 [Melastoma candidum]